MNPRWLVDLGKLAFVIVILLLLAKAASGHDWYPPNCCSGHDCRPIGEDIVTITDGGFFVKESNETIPFNDPRIKKTPPEGGSKYHRCSQGGKPEGETICLYIPNWGS